MTSTDIQNIKNRFGIIGNTAALNRAINIAIQVAPTEMSVLINGESGSGKESFSKIIHQLSARKHGQFIAINCGAIPEGTIDSELFGHEKGSFTGATDSRKGYFEVTDGGSIFLDEIAEMPMSTQARLLRVLENGEFIKVGSSKVHKTNVRVVAATNVNLLDAVQKNKFREDLYYRLNTITITVPPLRERGDDIVLLFRKFAADFSEKYRVTPIQLDDDAKLLLKKYRFPGNIRELMNLVNRISVLAVDNRHLNGQQLAEFLPENSSSLPAVYRANLNDENPGLSERDILYKVLFDMKKDMNDLKKLVLSLLQDDASSDQVLTDHREVFNSLRAEPKSSASTPEQIFYPKEAELRPGLEIKTAIPTTNDYEIQDISHEMEDDDSLLLERKEKELIIKALQKNQNKRKYAAKDLGISERTLYRKIKQYEIQE